MNFDLTLQLGEKIMGEGGSGYGVSDLTDIKDFPFPGLSYGVTIMLALSPEIVSGIGDGPTRTYHDEYERVNGELARTGSETVRFLEGAGFRAVLLGPTSEQFDESTLSVPFPHKTAAIRAGVGWIGKSDLLVSEEFGSAFRMCTVLTDAPLTPGTPSTESLCGPCRACVEACPAKAPTGREWSAGTHRDELVDIFACYRQTRDFTKEMGWSHSICGICIQACPWTQKYISSRSCP
ncbi:MAG: 4Fe-4S double cluster binding domain-containing protein [Thermovirgaceae bacterium]|jgi:epoxyqueuosine reductase QueG|nr:4Fe-4S double cluster binding domain-containing protein [Synergistales bacterium]MDI9393330.1 4Fe-4S double cluster binding domain-containing protein [Synergistota bacterium]MDY0178740.1 4Fe-4S double cluster binding domain-containing protein [Synergistaceae bacterium]HRW87441.1 4Fe-4S double cluster binding domain-containing protein [Thermovirgaceae bacterium]MDD3830530.1 4Fe-4S double cluster binding domain-containing protein [Synergistales bacterium]